MELTIRPSVLQGTLRVPGSKSHTIRGLILATLAEGRSVLERPLESEDTMACLEACRSLGACITAEKKEGMLQWVIHGSSRQGGVKDQRIDCRNSGTTASLMSAAVALGSEPFVLDGDASLRSRPMQSLLDALNGLGARAASLEGNGRCPVRIQGPLQGGDALVTGVTSQYLSALLLALPLAPRDSRVTVHDLHEKPYVRMTLSWLDFMGIRYKEESLEHFHIPGRQSYRPFQKRIPADFSTACFPLLAAAIAPGSDIRLEGLEFNDSQGDKAVFQHASDMGLSVEHRGNLVRMRQASLSGRTIDLNDNPDALPVMAVLGCFASGQTVLHNVAQARIKECDRIRAMACELQKMGGKVTERIDGLVIEHSPLKGVRVCGWGDHRIVMALALAGLAAPGETVVDTAEAAQVTYPGFVEDFRSLGADLSLL